MMKSYKCRLNIPTLILCFGIEESTFEGERRSLYFFSLLLIGKDLILITHLINNNVISFLALAKSHYNPINPIYLLYLGIQISGEKAPNRTMTR